MRYFFLILSFFILTSLCHAYDKTDYDIAVNLYNSGDYRASLRRISKIEAEGGLDAKMCLLRYEIYKKQNKELKAKEALFKALEYDRGCYEAYIALAITALSNSNSAEAKEYFKKALDMNAELAQSADILYYYAKICILDRDYNQALRNILKAIEINGSDSSYYLELGKIYLYQGDYLKAINALEYALSEDYKVNSECYNYIGLAYYKRGNIKTALENFRLAVQSDPDNVIYLNNLGLCYKSLNMPDESRKIASTISSITPKTPEEIIKMSQILYARKNYEGAKKVINDGLVQFPNNLLLKAASTKLNKL